MGRFNLWWESLIFASVFSGIVILPCVCIAIIGRKMIEQLGLYPSQSPKIQMSVLWQLIIIEVITFTLWMWFYVFFSDVKKGV